MHDQTPCIDFGELESVYAPLAESLRRLIDISIRTEAGAAAVAAATSKIDSAAAELSGALKPGPFGVHRNPDGQTIAWGNAVVGLRNPIAPPLVIHHEPDGVVWSEFVLGAAYEGPPDTVHGGVCALVLDHVLGATAHQPDKPAFTGTLTLRYRRPTALGRPLRAQAHVERVEGVKTFAVGHLADEHGVTVEAEGIFIHPRPAAE
ncbi:PaaI family thioesterase [Mycobacterium intracellulare]|uniref:PaaI family thioesterase n=1 Tax=Mycobacterium intracellulare TaxID=1767 RepID=UPI00045046A8|nr:PaaI family thioesterase [Mycobacterium intracellulare]AOS94190.1 thioesterase [Mycobacterium intracellulare subsp. chimaera]ARV84736.1 thioesterase [Mycobacterium intracellulare subsp. chimaera]ASL12118.1 thioesterase superfamily protein [Mycobacterium intracellulare subsp. chimaera]ASL24067.1 thioesterase superfamily protein [Mycobacterium intracellulare subsp. chimaera]ETZ26082.1 thioesterase superfamily protein [Mycobacterium intracellulare MIN_052511_1280]